MTIKNEFDSFGNFKNDKSLNDQLTDLLKPLFDKQNNPFPEDKIDALSSSLTTYFLSLDPPKPLSLEEFQKMSFDEKVDTIKNLKKSLQSHSRNQLATQLLANLEAKKKLDFKKLMGKTPIPTTPKTLASNFVDLSKKFKAGDFLCNEKQEKQTFEMLFRIYDKNFFPTTVTAFQLNKKRNCGLDSCSFIGATIVAIEKVLQMTQSQHTCKDKLHRERFSLEKTITVSSSLKFLHNFILAYVNHLDDLGWDFAANGFSPNEQTLGEFYSNLITLTTFQDKMHKCNLKNSSVKNSSVQKAVSEILLDKFFSANLHKHVCFDFDEYKPEPLLNQVSGPQSFLEPVNNYILVTNIVEISEFAFDCILAYVEHIGEDRNRKGLFCLRYPALSPLVDRNEINPFRQKVAELFTTLNWQSHYQPEIILPTRASIK